MASKICPGRITHYSRFIAKLAKAENQELLLAIFHGAVDELKELLPDLGESVAVDGTGISSRESGKEKSDKDAGWGYERSDWMTAPRKRRAGMATLLCLR